MCGILGVAHATDPPLADAAFRELLSRLRHRGPDAMETYAAPHGRLLLGHVRLSIIDLSEANNQPFRTGRTVTVFNGEVYNFPALRSELTRQGVTFQTAGDTEVIARGYEAWGEAVFARLEGMYAIGIYDVAADRLVLARDVFGIKPLYVFHAGAEFRFASELKALGVSGRLPLDRDVVFDLATFGYPLSDGTLLAGVEQVAPGDVWTAEPRGGAWCVARRQAKRLASIADAAEPSADALRSRLAASVEAHLLADVPLAVSLSGGLDSSIVATLLARGGARLHAYTNTFAASGVDPEVEHARHLASHLGLPHTVLQSRVEDLGELLREAAWFLEDPIPNPGLLHSYYVARALRRDGYKVVLLGEGADELFAGYPWHRAALAYGRQGPRRVFAELERQRSIYRSLVRRQQPSAARWTQARRAAQSARFEAAWNACDRGPLERLLHFDRRFELVGNQLQRVDRMLMRHAIEGRVPFLYDGVLAAAAALGDARKTRLPRWWERLTGLSLGRREKLGLADALRADLPAVVAEREKWGGRGTVNLLRSDALSQLDDVYRRVLTEPALAEARAVVGDWFDFDALAAWRSQRGRLFICLLLHSIDQHVLGHAWTEDSAGTTLRRRAA